MPPAVVCRCSRHAHACRRAMLLIFCFAVVVILPCVECLIFCRLMFAARAHALFRLRLLYARCHAARYCCLLFMPYAPCCCSLYTRRAILLIFRFSILCATESAEAAENARDAAVRYARYARSASMRVAARKDDAAACTSADRVMQMARMRYNATVMRRCARDGAAPAICRMS